MKGVESMKDSNIGTIIKTKRLEKRLTQEKLGELIGANKGSISRYENGEIKNMVIDKAQQLCKVLELSPLIFIDEEEQDILTPQQLKNEISNSLSKCPFLNENERQLIMNNVSFICDNK